jgi:hypothetical protein
VKRARSAEYETQSAHIQRSRRFAEATNSKKTFLSERVVMYCECEICQAQRKHEEALREEEEALDAQDNELDEDELFDREQLRLAECTCGAYQIGKNGYYQVADCVCGRT